MACRKVTPLGRLLLLFFLALPLIEIACFILVGQAIGLWPTLFGVVLGSLIGALILRAQGLSLVNEMRSSAARREVPAQAIADSMMVAAAGILLLVPGYFTDLLGILLLIPPLRGAIYAWLKSKVTVVTTTSASYGFAQKRVDDGTIELSDDEYRPR